MKAWMKAGAASLGIVLAACQTVPPTKGTPALLTNPSVKLTGQINQLVSEALNGASITVAPDVLTQSSSLIIELAGRGDPMMGRRMDRPDHFTLSLNGNKCILTHEESGESYYLRGAKCKAM